MLGESAIALARDIFDQPTLFRHAHRIHRREVAWTRSEEPVTFEHSAVVVSEEELLSELPVTRNAEGTPGGFTLVAAPQPDSVSLRFCCRHAEAMHVTLKPDADFAACGIESFPDGWFFLLPNGGASAWLLSVGGDLESSRLIGPRIASASRPAGRFHSEPALSQPLSGPGWLALGSAAMAFDPICGEGTAHALREAVLAAAAVRAIADGEPEDDVRAHYESRMLLGFRRHLSLVLAFYRSGHGGAWWDAQAKGTDAHIAWCDERIAAFGPPRYRLNNIKLEALE